MLSQAHLDKIEEAKANSMWLLCLNNDTAYPPDRAEEAMTKVKAGANSWVVVDPAQHLFTLKMRLQYATSRYDDMETRYAEWLKR